MIFLRRVRLINWYGFSNVTAPIGTFTLIAGKNGNGKSVMLDAIKYAVYGDTVFNKSSESKGSRTLSSYTRGLLDATAGTYMRPADKIPTVYSHIALEFYDDMMEKPFILGVVIETSSANNYLTYRYVIDKKFLKEVEHTQIKQEMMLPYSASGLQKKYGLTLMNREQGIPRFMQMTGLKLNLNQTSVYLRKLRGVMSYDPNAKIDRFIRESVLEERNIDFTRLIEAKENIERLDQTFYAIQDEIKELEEILEAYDAYERIKTQLLSDDIKIVYKKIKGLKAQIELQKNEQNLARVQKEEINQVRENLKEQGRELEERLIQAKISQKGLDCTKMIEEEEKRFHSLTEERKKAASEKQRLEEFQEKVSELLFLFHQEKKAVEKKEVLASLCENNYSAIEKENAIVRLKKLVEESYDGQIKKLALFDQELETIRQKLSEQTKILEECKKHRNDYSQIPEYVKLRDEINSEFAKRNISSRAQFACEYVIGISNEEWRNAIEAYLGIRRYTILVEPEYYPIADGVLNRSSYRYAHLFNTRLLMKKKMEPEADSVVHMLEIRNPVAKKYFEYQLGRMHAVEIKEIRNYENAISKEGRVSVGMDSYFLRFDKIRFYFLGHKIYELNQLRAEQEIERLQLQKQEIVSKKEEQEACKIRFGQYKEAFLNYHYDAVQTYQKAEARFLESQKQLEQLKKAQQDNQEFLELNQLVIRLQKEQTDIRQEQEKKLQESAELETKIRILENTILGKSTDLEAEEAQLKDYQITSYSIVQKAIENYENTRLGLLSQEEKLQLKNKLEQHRDILIGLQSSYNGKYMEHQFMVDLEHREIYAARKEQIWIDNLQEIRQKLEEQTKRYEEIFKNEFVLTILKSCEKAQEDFKQMNLELARLQFSATYQFDVHYVKDGSEYAKIIEYARYLDEREQLGESAGQMSFDEVISTSDEKGEQLERDLKQIINRIIEKNSEETMMRFADYRNYMTYEILISNAVLDHAKLSRQTGYNSGAEVQIPYLLILISALLMVYNQRTNSTRLVFIDEPFAKMDPGNVKLMLNFMKRQRLQVIFCSPDKTETIGSECEVILPVLRVRSDSMQLGIVQFHEEKVDR